MGFRQVLLMSQLPLGVFKGTCNEDWIWPNSTELLALEKLKRQDVAWRNELRELHQPNPP